jgi:hypothetical protein
VLWPSTLDVVIHVARTVQECRVYIVQKYHFVKELCSWNTVQYVLNGIYWAITGQWPLCPSRTATSTLSSMDHIPPELWAEIFSFACLDDGTTGRILSLVSKYVYRVSKPSKLQSIVLRGLDQTVAFLSLLQATPEHHRRVCHLFAYEYHENDVQPISMSGPLKHILHTVRDTLQTLAIRFDHSDMYSLYPMDLPVLEELTVFSMFIDNSYKAPIKPLTHLKRIHYGGPFFAQYDADVFSALCEVAPNLTHFRFSEVKANSQIASHLEAVLGLDEPSPSQDGANTTFRLPSTIATVVVQPASVENHGIRAIADMMTMLQRLALRGRQRGVIILPADKARSYARGWRKMENEWLERIHGGRGCW